MRLVGVRSDGRHADFADRARLLILHGYGPRVRYIVPPRWYRGATCARSTMVPAHPPSIAHEHFTSIAPCGAERPARGSLLAPGPSHGALRVSVAPQRRLGDLRLMAGFRKPVPPHPVPREPPRPETCKCRRWNWIPRAARDAGKASVRADVRRVCAPRRWETRADVPFSRVASCCSVLAIQGVVPMMNMFILFIYGFL
ncbi:uncharacterized protein LAESUDRAFT_387280 [Laetiporus sulphureus 93-53]|uniref:Uncharacterized protein n=1 Tax=Laetiporus sulphureus 93-53 TaxID=1314785 RepID=A0A165CKF8_9APHY|nr:uncharacterized protein LAESUDRAFT_387280 [Laetiporus sulphureus 93-53]KZT02975.1 hypothetical protein LAESUDRAFT_387280 [Laetiporus sulphureus 93-53]